MYAFHMDTKRWFLLTLHQKLGHKRKRDKKQLKLENETEANGGMEEDEGNEEEEEELENEQNEEIGSDEIAPSTLNLEKFEHPKQQESEKESNQEISQQDVHPILDTVDTNKEFNQEIIQDVHPIPDTVDTKKESPKFQSLLPSPRINSLMVSVNNILYLYGGIFETPNEREVTYNDLHGLSLHKMDTFVTFIESDLPDWLGEESDEEDDDEDDEEDDSDSDDSDEDEEKELETSPEQQKEEKKEKENEVLEIKKKTKSKKGHLEDLKKRLAEFQRDGKPTANPNETLKEFAERTSDFWSKVAYEANSILTDSKAQRKEGFVIAEERWNQMRILLEDFEKLEQEEKEEKELERKKREKEKLKNVKSLKKR